MTIGDILAVIALLVVSGAAWGSAILLTAMLFPAKVQSTRETIIESPVKCFWRGALVVGVLSLLAAATMSKPGPIRLVSISMIGLLAYCAAVGSASIVRMMSERIGSEGTEMAPFARLTRASFLYVGAGFLPVIGWFVILPVATMICAGGAIVTLRTRRVAIPQTPSPMTPVLTAESHS